MLPFVAGIALWLESYAATIATAAKYMVDPDAVV
jgi:hypothetical protein